MPDINVNKLSEALNAKADIDLNNTGVFSTSEGGGVNLTSSTPANASGKEVTSADFIKSDIQSNLLNYTTNRILEIPQDIKLELNNGTLTLKAGSKVYVPNGFESDGTTPKFDEFITSNDIIDNDFGNASKEVAFLLTKSDSANNFSVWNGGTVVSGTSAPDFSGSNYWGVWYDTSNNIIKIQDGTNEWKTEYGFSFPFCLVSSSSSAVTSLDQVFNGFGYIGSTIFSLPGIKCLVGNGRNPDGSCITKIEESTKVTTYTINAYRPNNKIVLYNSKVNVRGLLWFDEQVNMCYNNVTTISAYQPTAILGTFSTNTTSPWNITEFKPLGVDSLANSNASNFSKAGESYLSSLGMPSNKYIDLTLGASGTTYTAPANGWFWFSKIAGTNLFGVSIKNKRNGMIIGSDAGATGSGNAVMPVLAGDNVVVRYSATGETLGFRFIYSQGDQ